VKQISRNDGSRCKLAASVAAVFGRIGHVFDTTGEQSPKAWGWGRLDEKGCGVPRHGRGMH
jgi:hypothetical protein